MGVAFSFLPFFDLCHQRNAFNGPVVALGSLILAEREDKILEFARLNNYDRLRRDKSVKALLHDRYGIDKYIDLDINEKAELNADLSKPLDSTLRNSAMTVINAGTLEHVFDIKQAFQNVHDMTRQGGVIIHIAPLTWLEHGFYNFSITMFNQIAETNSYEYIADAIFYPSAEQKDNFNIQMNWSGKLYKFKPEELKCLKPDTLFISAYRKTDSSVFKAPYEIAY